MTYPFYFARLGSHAVEMGQRLLLRLLPGTALPEKNPSKSPYLDWSDINQVGDPQIDEQHKLLVGLINLLHRSLMLEHDRSRADDLFDHFTHAARNHFTHEESVLMEQYCPEYGHHFDQHSKAIAEIQDLFRQFKVGEMSAPVVLFRLRTWMVSHSRPDRHQAKSYLSQPGRSQG